MAKAVVKNVVAPVVGVRPSTLKRGTMVTIVDPKSILKGKLGIVGRDEVVTFGGGIADEDYLVVPFAKGTELSLVQR